MRNTPLFGVNIDPAISELETSYALAALADRAGLELIMVQDHPYNRRHFDTWTLVTALALRTERAHVGTNVVSLPLRPPAMLAKAAATLDVLSGGRVELGIGAGGYWQGIEAFGVAERTPGEAYRGVEDAVSIIRGLWNSDGRSVSYDGTIYQVKGAQFGPAPAHPIRIWIGGYGPKMLRLTGRMADGLLVSTTYSPPDKLAGFNQIIDEGAAEAGRAPSDIRRGYNVTGLLDYGQIGRKPAGLQPGILYGTPREWADILLDYYHNYGQDAFIFWGVGENALAQTEAFANEVMPLVKAGAER